ncbi:MAG: serine--tRNA ligase [Deltaproteobacteria bacterium]|nr:serine--tRNA ligase [Deltaproteobacteria bacterium]
MLDHRVFLNDPDSVFAGLRRRGISPELLQKLVDLADRRRQAIQQAESLRYEQNQATAEMQQIAKSGDSQAVANSREQLKSLKAKIKDAQEAQNAAEQALEEAMLHVPNLPQASVPDGADESANKTERVVGEIPNFSFSAKPHWEIAESLGLVSFEQASKISGARFAVYRDAGARLERALIAFMLDVAREHGYTEIAPPLLVKSTAMVGAGQYPKFVGESFETLDSEFVLIPTSEVPLVNLHSDEILAEAQLPLRYTAFTPCFRREAGAAGKDTRGLIRQHQFNKVELVSITTPEQSEAEHERLTRDAEEILNRLELPYRVVSLCAGDLGFSSTKTYDLEVWLPGQNTYREISSCSNCGDFQARRAQIRFKPSDNKQKAKLVHTLNGSALAVGRTFVAICENYQQKDGSVVIPKALVPYFGAEYISRS